MATQHKMTLWEIGGALYHAGLLAEYEALKGYADERSELIKAVVKHSDLLDLVQTANHATTGTHTVMWQTKQHNVLADLQSTKFPPTSKADGLS